MVGSGIFTAHCNLLKDEIVLFPPNVETMRVERRRCVQNVNAIQAGVVWDVRKILQVLMSAHPSSLDVLNYLPWNLHVLVNGRSFL